MSAILNSAILDSTILNKRKLHSFILTQLDDGSHLEFCHVRFRNHLGFRYLVIFSHMHSKHSHSTLTLTETNSSDSNSHCLTWWWQHLEFCHLGFILTNLWLKLIQLTQTHSFSLKMSAIWILHSAILHNKTYSFILTQLDDGSHLELCHVGFRHCHLGFRHLVIFSQIHSKTLSLHSDSDKLIQSD